MTTFNSPSVIRACVGILQEQAARHVLDHRARRGGVNLDKAQILLGRKALAGFRRERRGGDGLDKQLG